MKNKPTPQPKLISIKLIHVDPTVQIRLRTPQPMVEEYSQAGELPPLQVFRRPKEGDYLLADGHIRLLACQLIDKEKVSCIINEIEDAEGFDTDHIASAALYVGIKRNVDHGLRLTFEDRKNAVKKCLADSVISKWGVKRIAQLCHVSTSTVSDIKSPAKAEERKKRASGKTTVREHQRNVTPGATVEERLRTIREWIDHTVLTEEDVIQMFQTETGHYVWQEKIVSVGAAAAAGETTDQQADSQE